MGDLTIFTVCAIVLVPFVWLTLPVSILFVENDPALAGCATACGFGGSVIVDGLLSVDAKEAVPFAALSSLAFLLATALCFGCAFARETDAQREQRIAARMAADCQRCDNIPAEFAPVNHLVLIVAFCCNTAQPAAAWARALWRAWRPTRRHAAQHA